jgi:hypothetical protein
MPGRAARRSRLVRRHLARRELLVAVAMLVNSEAGAGPRRPAAGPARRRAGRRGDVLPGLRVRRRRGAQLGHAVDLGFLAAAVAGLAAFAARQARTADPLLPPRVVLNRNRGGAYLAMLFVSAGAFGILLFLTFYLQTTLRYSPLVTGLAFLPFPAAVVVSVNVGQVVLMPRTGPKPLIGLGLLIAAGGVVWLTRIGVHSGYASAILGPLLVTGLGIGRYSPPRRTPARTASRRTTPGWPRRPSTSASRSAARSAPRCSTRWWPAPPPATWRRT